MLNRTEGAHFDQKSIPVLLNDINKTEQEVSLDIQSLE
jgi:hypothetical protein